MIRHSVILKLKSTINTEEKQAFFEAVEKLAEIPYVKKFEVLIQKSVKNKFDYGISMEFDNQTQYDFYSNHAEHQAFIHNFWLKSVDDFLEIDYVIK